MIHDEPIYEKGLVKVVWLSTTEVIYSKMFDTVEQAEQYAQEQQLDDYLIFKLLEQKEMTDFSWELVPYGKFKLYQRLLKLYNKGLLKRLINKFSK